MKTLFNTLKPALLFIAAGFLAGAASLNAQTVTFPDANLEAVVRDTLGIPENPVTVEDMLLLTWLDATGRGIEDTTGLETAANLTHLVFSSNPVTNYTGIAGLTNLMELRFDYGSISSVAFLSGLTRLELLEIYQNDIEDLTPLAALTHLRDLQLDWNPATNHAALSGLTNLYNLSLAGNGVSNLTFIAPLIRLQHLGLYDCHVQDLSPLAGWTNLVSLGLGWNGVTNPAVLATLTGLQGLYLSGNNLTNVPYLAGLTNLSGLDLAYTALADLTPLTNLTALNWLNVGENQLVSLPDLSPLTNLSTFMMAGNQIADLSPLAGKLSLTELHLQRNPFQDISPLTACFNLGALLFYNNTSITNLSRLGEVTGLQNLQLQAMQITNLNEVSFLAELPGLYYLDLSHNHIADLSPLTSCPSLSSLVVQNNRLQQIEPLLDIPLLYYADLRYNGLDTNAAAGNVIASLQERGVTVEYDPQLELPVAIQFLSQPANRSAYTNDTVIFSASLTGGTPFASFRWQKDGVDLADDSRISGTESDTLQIDSLEPGDAGFYRLVVWDDWVVTNSVTVELKVITNVAFADAGIEQAVREALGIPEDPLTPDALAGLYSLDLSYLGITNLAGLEAAANLVGLNLSGNPSIADRSPLTFLAALNDLAYNDAGLDDLAWAAGLRTLTSLQVNANFIADLSPLRALADLYAFSVTENQLTVIDPLLDLPALAGDVQLSWNRLDTNDTSAAWAVITNLTARGATVYFEPQYPAPVHPEIVLQPVSVATFPGDSANFAAWAVSDGMSVNYRWLRNGVNLYDEDRISGADSDTLRIENLQLADAGSYRVRIWDEFGVTNSVTVTLRLITNVAFVDPNLEQAVRDWVGIPTAPLTPEDVAPVTWLYADNRGITNISGLEACGNLDWLSLGDNPDLTDYTPLTQLPRLNYLNLNANGGSDLAFVASLAPLSDLYLWNWNLSDLSPLAGQTALIRLNLAYSSGITDFTVLNNLTNLEVLRLEGTWVDDIAFAALMPNLREFSFEQSAVWDLSPLAGAGNLLWLDMANNPISDPAPLAGCTNLEWLSAGYNQITDLSVVTGLTKLKFLAVYNNPLSDLSPLTGLTNLTQLDISATLATDLAPVATLTGLSDFHAGQLGLSSLDFLASLINLQVLGLGDNLLTTLPPYPHLNQLRWLNLDNNPLASFSFVAGMSELTDLYLNHTGVRDLSPLAGCTSLINLGLAGNGITDLAPLASLTRLRWLTLWDNQVQNLSALSGLTSLTYVDLRYNLVDWFGPGPALTVVQTLQGRGVYVDYDPQSAGAIFLLSPERLTGTRFRFAIHSAPGSVLNLWKTVDFKTWWPVAVFSNTSGTNAYTDEAADWPFYFYRATPH